MSLFLWFRRLVLQKLVDQHRFHLGAEMRAAGREVSFEQLALEASSEAIAIRLVAETSTPETEAVGAETRLRVQQALESMEPIDREILTLRHIEGLTNAEAAQVLDIQPRAASKRYFRALKRLKEILPFPH